MLNNIILPEIDPVIFSIGPLTIRWYAISYVAGILLGWFAIKKLNKIYDKKSLEPALTEKAYDNLITFAVLGIIIGGRLGYVFFYNLSYYIQNPHLILAIWEGGMSFHGGLIGITCAFYLMSRHYQLEFLKIMDLIAVAAPIGLFFGRIANFINNELVGRIMQSDLVWGVVYPGDVSVRHPSQIYQALTEGLLLFIILQFLFRKTNLIANPGKIASLFLIFYGIFRFVTEFFREPDQQIGLIFDIFTMGQILCFIMTCLGVLILTRKNQNA